MLNDFTGINGEECEVKVQIFIGLLIILLSSHSTLDIVNKIKFKIKIKRTLTLSNSFFLTSIELIILGIFLLEIMKKYFYKITLDYFKLLLISRIFMLFDFPFLW